MMLHEYCIIASGLVRVIIITTINKLVSERMKDANAAMTLLEK